MKKKNHSGEIEVSGYFSTGWKGEGEEEVAEKKSLHWLVIITTIVVVTLFLRVSFLQVWLGSYYRAQAEDNSIRHIYTDAPRGLIYDKSHAILAGNAPKFDLALIPALAPKDANERKALLAEVSKITELNIDEIEEKYKETKPDSFSSIIIKEDLTREEALKIEANSSNWRGILLDKRAKREYPLSEADSHIIGYAGKITNQELKQNPSYDLNDYIGKDGIEETYEKNLRGKKGENQLEVDSTGKVKRIVGTIMPVIGNSVVLSVDKDIQNEAFQALKEKVEESGGTGGAVVAMDPRDGGIIALDSFPSYNNNDFVGKISQETLENTIKNPQRPLFDRAVAGMYPPGSTFKPLVAAAALTKGIISADETLSCPAVLNVGQWHFEDWKFHGDTDLNRAIAESVNTYFYIIGGGWGDKKGLGVENIESSAKLCGLGQKTGIDIPQEAEGLVPDPDWKKKIKNEPWYIGDTYHFSIGQGDLLVTPLQLANYVSAIVNGGTLYRPHLLESVENPDGGIIEKNKPEIIRKDIFPAGVLASVKRAMGETVLSEKGSGRKLQELVQKYNVNIGGKTGTAQNGDPDDDKYHSWFVGFAPLENPEIVIVAMVERGGEGYEVALPIAERVLDVYLGKRAGQQ